MSSRPDGWGLPNNRPTVPPSPLTTSTPAGIGKWAPPISKWAKPQKPPFKAESQNRLAPQRQNPQTSLPLNRGLKPNPFVSFTPSRGAPTPGKWSRPPGFAPQKISVKPAANEPIAELPRSKVEERSGRTYFRKEQEPKLGESSRLFIQPREDEYTTRQPRRWEGNGKHKTRGSLLFQREGGDVIPRQSRVHDMRITSKPKIQKAKKSLRINPDINVPSTVSVGNFARLLNVSLGKDFGLFDCGVHR